MRQELEAATGVRHLRTLLVNVYLVRTDPGWMLVDTGLSGYATTIRAAARRLIGSDEPPTAIVLTHAHFDHVGSLEALLEVWDVPVYAHSLERPYLTGRSPYPPPDPLVGRGAMALISRLYPRGPIDVSRHLRALPDNGEVPGAAEWRWIHTPGHTAGHVSLFRERDRVLIAGDAVVTTKQESTLAVAAQRRELHGPPAYFTQDWRAAGNSVGRLAALEPEVLATGHGDPLAGSDMRQHLRRLAATFDEREVPAFGRYAKEPAITDEDGIVRLPPDPLPKVVAGVATAAAVAWTVAMGAARARRTAATDAHG
jgi:glyoxylase-like metal-dependent hydrolase (beta-lactamase superfamily II)